MSNDGNGPGSSTYSSEFRNLFGGDSHGSERESSSNENPAGALNPLPPSSLLSQEPVNVFEEQNMSQNNITPSILLEQLAYVDNFMPSLEQDFANLDSWILQDPDGGEPNQVSQGSNGGAALGFDERLAAELSAFADDSFIFPDEDKRHASARGVGNSNGGDGDNSSNDDNDNKDNKGGNNNNTNDGSNGSNSNSSNDSSGNSGVGRRSTHFLTQRRNTFLTSQYDHSKSRFSSKSRSSRNDGSSNNSHPTEDGQARDNDTDEASPLQDHGGFTNVDIVSGASNSGGLNNATSVMAPTGYSPNVPSPLSNILASQVIQPYSVSASPITRTASRPSDSVSVASSAAEQASMVVQGHPQIQMPDYSTIPTSTLVALLPRVTVPPGAHRTLTENGFTQEQIDAIAALIAYHEQEKLKQRTNDLRSGESSGNANESGSDASRNAGFLLDILSRGSQQTESRDTGFADSVLQLEVHREDSPRREGSLRSGSLSIKAEPEEMQGDLPSAAKLSKEETDGKQRMKRSKSTGDGVPSSFQQIKKRHASSPSLSPSPPPQSNAATTIAAQTQKSHQRRKVKEKELEASVAELSELAISLQQKVHTLEMENKLLKNLVVSSGELEGIEKAENIKKQLLEKINGSENKSVSLAKSME
ncbi:ZYBA0S12-01046g1_1 [Zygosaccharomyces bailii CLIB 213]|uniref:ZYBA0S12-01046g1_1 n=1 Tax=Zygosaccharomyces bailii (strain CLIB 213 / ATCC 58445 / CBS 680 / BCRC 21525 / NBRC 1098 / NCYC 1416 / NRRL Y-2227) TaxID=1333698 RepID=A0A8J2TBR1_ZYGB2|nr:ZYBA0S12-01046g1_1 [Zygosaccharomyces bailii CLIB 213]